jgi:hypothetical protein
MLKPYGVKIKNPDKFGTLFFKKNGKRPTSHRSTTYLCYVPILEDFAGAGRVGLADANIQSFCFFARILEQYKYICDRIFNTKK